MLQHVNLSAERRLRHVHPRGRTSEVQLFTNGDEALQLPERKHDLGIVSINA